MDLDSGYPFWTVKNGLMHPFPPLGRDLRCDVLVIGAGITGALVADTLHARGHAVCVLDARDVGWGSTAASTALLQYEIDTHMIDLAKQYGEADAVLAYRACLSAIDWVEQRAKSVRDVDYGNMSSLYFASRRRDAKALREEFDLRQRHGFPVEWLGAGDVDERFGIDAPAAILSRRAARIDPYRMAQRLLQRLQTKGVPVHDRSVVSRIEANSRGVIIDTAEGFSVRAKHLVLATGYATQQFIDQHVAKNRSSYAYVTEPIDPALLGPLRDTMVWESARPYLYLRATGDRRLVVGGEDDAVDIPAKRDASVAAKARKLAKRMATLFPHIDVTPSFAWAGTFAETKDGLPWIGAHPAHGPRVHFAMAYGGNGITYSAIGAEIIAAAIERRRHPLAELFGFARLKR